MYRTEDRQPKIDVIFDEETVWLTQDKMADLFQKSRSTITGHIHNIFDEGELNENEVMTSVGNSDGSIKHRPPQLYNLDLILAVGYRVKSAKGRAFKAAARPGEQSYAERRDLGGGV